MPHKSFPVDLEFLLIQPVSYSPCSACPSAPFLGGAGEVKPRMMDYIVQKRQKV